MDAGGDAFQRAINAIYATVADPRNWPDALAVVSDVIGTSGAMVAFDPRDGRPGFLTIGRLREDLVEVYLKHHAVNPFSDALRWAPPGKPILCSAIVDIKAVRRTALYADVLKPQGIENQVAIVHPSLMSPRGSGGFAFTMTGRQGHDAAAVLGRLQPLVPHLSRAIDLSLQFGSRLSDNRPLVEALAAMSSRCLLLDQRGSIVYANAPAEALLTEGDGLSIDHSNKTKMRLTANNRDDDRALNSAIETVVDVAMGWNRPWTPTVRVSRRLGRAPWLVLLTPLRGPEHPFAFAVPRETCVLVQVLGPSSISERQADFARQTFGLTAAEVRVASLIGGGLSAPQVARLLDVSLTTVKSHLSRCFDKTEVRTQVELALLLATMPPSSAVTPVTNF